MARRRKRNAKSSSAARMARLRARRAEGRDFVAPVGMRWHFISEMVDQGFLDARHLDDVMEIGRAIERLLDIIGWRKNK